MKINAKLSITFTIALLGGLLICSSVALAATAEDAAAQGKALLAKGDFNGAMKAYATAVRADRENQEYLNQFSMLRQVIALRNRLENEKDPERWEYIARALQTYYIDERIYPAALNLGTQIHAKLNTASSAHMLAETQLAMDKNAEAEKMLSALDPQKATLATKSLHGLALIGLDKVDRAKEIAKSIGAPQNDGPRGLYCAARLQAALGNAPEAVDLLTSCMEKVPPSLQDGYRSHARECKDFALLSSSDEFAEALATESKVAESKCSGGSKCAGCPNRAKCAKANQ